MAICSKCPDEAIAWFGYSEFKKDTPLCYLHLKESREIGTESNSTIDITISHDAYETIKAKFKEYRDKAGMKYAFSKSYETEAFFHHEWHGSDDFISIEFGYDKSKSTKDNPHIINAKINYIFSKKSTIAGFIFGMLFVIDSNTKIQSNDKSSQIQIVDNKELLKSNFLSSINSSFSEDFVINTVRCIDSGILTQVLSLHSLPFSSVSRFGTKGEILTNEDAETTNADT